MNNKPNYNSYSNFQNAFNPLPQMKINGTNPKSFFTNNDFVNDNQLLHNNINKNVINEEIREYSIIIDSKDRNYQVYPDPFSYEVKFNPLPKTRELVNGKYVSFEEPNPIINDNIKNVRYIKLQEIILPIYNKITFIHNNNQDDSTEESNGELNGEWRVDVTKPLTDNMYVVLSLGDNYHDDNYLCTNDVLSNSFATVYYDSKLNDTHYFGFTSNGIKFFPPDQLAKIDKFKISFVDPYGNPIKCSHVNKAIMSDMECTCEDPDGDYGTDCFKHNLFHPLNPIFQSHLHFKIGVVQPRLNKLNFQ